MTSTGGPRQHGIALHCTTPPRTTPPRGVRPCRVTHRQQSNAALPTTPSVVQRSARPALHCKASTAMHGRATESNIGPCKASPGKHCPGLASGVVQSQHGTVRLVLAKDSTASPARHCKTAQGTGKHWRELQSPHRLAGYRPAMEFGAAERMASRA